MNEILKVHLFMGAVLLAASSIMKLWPPKKINSLYGYRTPRSMKSQDAWEAANSYSADLMLWAGVTTLIVQLVSYVSVGGPTSIFISLGYYLVFIFTSIFLTEKRLKARGF